MNRLKTTIFLCLILFITNLRTKTNKLSVKVFYDTLCIHSVELFQNNLDRIKNSQELRKFIDLKLIPGAKENFDIESNKFKCLHGDDECRGNKMHACALLLLEKEKAENYISCFMKEVESFGSIDETSQHCAGENYEDIHLCSLTSSADHYVLELLLLKKDSPEKILWSPSIVVGTELIHDSRYMGSDLIENICSKLKDKSNIKECQ
jgi:hypothetical protein